MSPITLIAFGIVGAILLELLTIYLRFGRRMTAPEKTAWLGRMTRGYRVHHGYHGFTLIPAGMLIFPGAAGEWLAIAGIALLLSDAIHHFIVLKWVTGHHEFWVKYPPREERAEYPVEELKKAA
tara:strand:- start:212 stop:583 length:372 start_codon:yes stop_codon:yes gene_type:complete